MAANRQRSAMSELREIARLHYDTASAEVQARAVEFFHAMDSDGDGQVDAEELCLFMSEHGHPPRFSDHRFFSLLDTDGSGGLSFDEVKTLFYIMASGRPFCSWCFEFIAGVFFTCSDCRFVLCPKCFEVAGGQPPDHFHRGRRSHFLDTYAFLQTLLSSHPQPQPQQNYEPLQQRSIPTPTPTPKREETANPSTSTINRQTSIIIRQRTSKREVTYKALMMALAAAPLIPCAIL